LESVVGRAVQQALDRYNNELAIDAIVVQAADFFHAHVDR